MEAKFDVEFLPDAVKFMNELDKKSQEKIYYNIRKAQITNDPTILKKLTSTIWDLEPFITKPVTAYLHFGINQKIRKLL